MRELTTHKVNGLNEALRIAVLDEPGAGGANHRYVIDTPTKPLGKELKSPAVHCEIEFQNGPIVEAGVNGVSNEALLAVVRDRLECFQAGPYACIENGNALQCVTDAMELLHERTRARLARGVEGTSAK